jgi:hypothetical protein
MAESAKGTKFSAGNYHKEDGIMNTKKFALGLIVVVLTMVSAVAVSAAGVIPDDCLGPVGVVDGNIICFLGFDDDLVQPNWTTWTYAVLRSTATAGNELSHITFDICIDDASAVIPNDEYTTLDNYNAFVGRGGVVYVVEVTGDPDPTTGVGGIKFQDPVYPASPEQMQAGEVHIFQFTQPTQSVGGYDPNKLRPVGFKNGNTGEPVYLYGPICDGSSAVELASFEAQSMSLFGRLLQWLGLR